MKTPFLNLDPALLLKAQGIKIIFLDVDGVLTDGRLYFTAEGESLKQFSTLDGHGLKMLQQAGITVAVVTGRDSAPLRVRLQALGITQVRYGTEDKAPAAQSILDALGLSWSQAAAMGDDWPDLPLLTRAALACAPQNAHLEVKARADYVCEQQGGAGAVRAVCDLLLVASGHYAQRLETYCS